MSYWESFVGKTLSSRYRLDRLIGYGGFGAVFEAEDLDLADRVAVKVMQSELANQVRREAVLARRFKHPNAVRVENVGTDGETPYIVMELLSGQTLDRLGRLGPDRLRQLVKQIGGALQAAHEQNLVHRDLKPQNIMLVDEHTPTERFVILDFGIAAQTDVQSTLRGATMDGAGTPEYMSPQQLIGADPTPQTDIYSFGVVLYWLVSGSLPFPCSSNSLVQYYNYVVDHDPPAFRDLNPELNVHPEIEALIRRCLAKEPSHRPASMRELTDEFLRIEAAEGLFNANAADIAPAAAAPHNGGEPPAATLVPDDRSAIAVSQTADSKTFGTTDERATHVETRPESMLDGITAKREPKPKPLRRKAAGVTLLAVAVLAGGAVGYPQVQRMRVQSALTTMIEQGDYGEAVRAIDAIDPWTEFWLNPQALREHIRQAGLNRAEDFVGAGQWEAALGECQKLDTAFPEDSKVHDVLLEIGAHFRAHLDELIQTGKFQEAEKTLTSGLAAHLASVDSVALDADSLRKDLLAHGLRRVSELAAAAQHAEALEQAHRLESVFGKSPELEQWLRREQVQVLVAEAEAHRSDHEYDKALAEYARAFELADDAGEQTAIRRKQGQAYRDAAREALEQIKPERTLKFITAGLQELAAENDAELLALKSELALLRGRAVKPSDPRAAVCDFLAAAKTETTASQAMAALEVVAVEFGQAGIEHFNTAEQLAARQDDDEADAQYRAAIDDLGIAILATGEAPELYYYRGFARSELKQPDYSGAISDLDRFRHMAIRLMESPDSRTDTPQLFTRYLITLSRLAWLKSTCPVDELREGDQAVRWAREAVERLTANMEMDQEHKELRVLLSTAYQALAAAHAENGDFERAIETTKQIQAEFLPDEREWQYHQQMRIDYYEKQRPVRDDRPPSPTREPAPCAEKKPETRSPNPRRKAPLRPNRVGGNDRSIPNSRSPMRN